MGKAKFTRVQSALIGKRMGFICFHCRTKGNKPKKVTAEVIEVRRYTRKRGKTTFYTYQMVGDYKGHEVFQFVAADKVGATGKAAGKAAAKPKPAARTRRAASPPTPPKRKYPRQRRQVKSTRKGMRMDFTCLRCGGKVRAYAKVSANAQGQKMAEGYDAAGHHVVKYITKVTPAPTKRRRTKVLAREKEARARSRSRSRSRSHSGGKPTGKTMKMYCMKCKKHVNATNVKYVRNKNTRGAKWRASGECKCGTKTSQFVGSKS